MYFCKVIERIIYNFNVKFFLFYGFRVQDLMVYFDFFYQRGFGVCFVKFSFWVQLVWRFVETFMLRLIRFNLILRRSWCIRIFLYNLYLIFFCFLICQVSFCKVKICYVSYLDGVVSEFSFFFRFQQQLFCICRSLGVFMGYQ